jgi:hypothetical protein
MQSGRQFEYEVVLDSEMDSNSAIPNWIGSPPSHAYLLGSPDTFGLGGVGRSPTN